MTLLRFIIFTLLVPGSVAVYVPYWLLQLFPDRYAIGDWQYSGMPLMLVGVVMYVISSISFLTEGGTPAIWFTKTFKFIVGEEPANLVRGNLFRFSRNPMYLGVLLFIIGEALRFGSAALLLYATVVWLFFHLTIVHLEEPHLRKKIGAAYDEYCKTVPRWIGLGKKQP